MPYGTVNADVIGTSVANSSLGAGNASNFKNRIINGAMVIDQRNSGSSVTASTTASYVYTLDRWRYYATAASKYTVQQNAGSVTLPVGFSNYLGATSSSAYSVGSGDTFFLSQVIEGYNIADLGWGTANAKTVTLSFQVYSSLTGTFGGSLRNLDTPNRSYPFNYTISSANTWTTISITIAGDTTGTWNTTNGQGIQVQWNLGSGSTFSGTANAWQSGNFIAPTGAVSVVGTNGATFYITGTQLEVGSSATGFEYRSIGTELDLCQRYFYLAAKNPTGSLAQQELCSGGWLSASQAEGVITYPVTMRTPASLQVTTVTGGYIAEFAPSSGSSFNGFGSYGNTQNSMLLYTSVGSGTAGYYARLAVVAGVAGTFVGFNAEL